MYFQLVPERYASCKSIEPLICHDLFGVMPYVQNVVVVVKCHDYLIPTRVLATCNAYIVRMSQSHLVFCTHSHILYIS
jgi:hypothetical protein